MYHDDHSVRGEQNMQMALFSVQPSALQEFFSIQTDHRQQTDILSLYHRQSIAAIEELQHEKNCNKKDQPDKLWPVFHVSVYIFFLTLYFLMWGTGSHREWKRSWSEAVPCGQCRCPDRLLVADHIPAR